MPEAKRVRGGEKRTTRIIEEDYSWLEKARKEKSRVRVMVDGKVEVGGPEILPAEASYDFGDLSERLKGGHSSSFVALYDLIDIDSVEVIPIVIEVGADGRANSEPSYSADSITRLIKEDFPDKLGRIIDVNLDSVINAAGRDCYVSSSVEGMSQFF